MPLGDALPSRIKACGRGANGLFSLQKWLCRPIQFLTAMGGQQSSPPEWPIAFAIPNVVVGVSKGRDEGREGSPLLIVRQNRVS